MATLNFDATKVDPSIPMEAIPAGYYTVQMVASEMKPTSNGQGAFLAVEFEILEGEYKGRKLFDRMNLQNANPMAVEIAYKTLSAICHSVGVVQVADSAQLHNRPLQAKVALRPAGLGNDGKHHDASNEIKGYKAVGNVVPVVPQTFTPPPAQPFVPPTQPVAQPVPLAQPAWAAVPVAQPTVPPVAPVAPAAAPTAAPWQAPTPPWATPAQ